MSSQARLRGTSVALHEAKIPPSQRSLRRVHSDRFALELVSQIVYALQDEGHVGIDLEGVFEPLEDHRFVVQLGVDQAHAGEGAEVAGLEFKSFFYVSN